MHIRYNASLLLPLYSMPPTPVLVSCLWTRHEDMKTAAPVDAGIHAITDMQVQGAS